MREGIRLIPKSERLPSHSLPLQFYYHAPRYQLYHAPRRYQLYPTLYPLLYALLYALATPGLKFYYQLGLPYPRPLGLV